MIKKDELEKFKRENEKLRKLAIATMIIEIFVIFIFILVAYY